MTLFSTQALRNLVIVGTALTLAGCFGGQEGYRDLDNYMAEVRTRPTGQIEALPEFRPYEAFTYSASGLRSPFEPPLKLALTSEVKNNNIRPNMQRPRQYLEKFEVDTFSLVGSISNDDGLWGLVRGEDGVHRVKVGDYLGKNHGRITYIDDEELRLIEIIPAGPSYWVERPRVLRLNP